METNQTPAMLPIFTTEPKAEAGKQVVFFRRKKVAESESDRAVLVPSYKLPSACYIEGEGDETTVQDAEEVFRIALADAFMDSASSILRRFCDEKRDAKQEAKEIPADMLTFSAVDCPPGSSAGLLSKVQARRRSRAPPWDSNRESR